MLKSRPLTSRSARSTFQDQRYIPSPPHMANTTKSINFNLCSSIQVIQSIEGLCLSSLAILKPDIQPSFAGHRSGRFLVRPKAYSAATAEATMPRKSFAAADTTFPGPVNLTNTYPA